MRTIGSKILWVALLLSFLSVATETMAQWPTHDRWGYRLPEHCRQDLTYLVPEVLVHYDHDNGWTPDGLKNIGLIEYPLGSGKAKIYLDRTLQDNDILIDVLQHELCHYLTWKKTGNGSWHRGDTNVPVGRKRVGE